jgi:hypothetical protein
MEVIDAGCTSATPGSLKRMAGLTMTSRSRTQAVARFFKGNESRKSGDSESHGITIMNKKNFLNTWKKNTVKSYETRWKT